MVVILKQRFFIPLAQKTISFLHFFTVLCTLFSSSYGTAVILFSKEPRGKPRGISEFELHLPFV